MKIFKYEVKFTLCVVAEDLTQVKELAAKMASKELLTNNFSEKYCNNFKEITKTSQIPDKWKDAIPWGPTKIKTVFELISENKK